MHYLSAGHLTFVQPKIIWNEGTCDAEQKTNLVPISISMLRYEGRPTYREEKQSMEGSSSEPKGKYEENE